MSPCERLPRFSTFNVFITCVLSSLVILIGVANRIGVFVYPIRLASSDGTDTRVMRQQPKHFSSLQWRELSFRTASPGEVLQVGDLQVHIATVVHNDEYPAKSGFNIFMNGWVKYNTSANFQCCLLRSSPNGTLIDDVITEVKSYTYHIYEQWIVDRQNAEFSCSVSSKQISGIGDANFTFVTFVKDSCLKAPSLVFPILHPQRVPNSVCVCLKLTYGSLSPENMIEWFEYTRLMGVTQVFTYYVDVTEPVLQVLQYYQRIGFLEMYPLQPAVGKDGEKLKYTHPRFDQQAWVDEVMAANDCKHRMAKYDYIIIMDMDEFIVPKGELTSYFQILQAASQQVPGACGFSFDSHVVMLDWGSTRSSPLHICRYTNRTVSPNYDGADRNTRWAFRPNMTFWVQNNLVHCKKPYKIASVPISMYTLLHYRSCKAVWIGCTKKPRIDDASVLKYELPLLGRILKLPLNELLPGNSTYLSTLVDWDRNQTHTSDSKPLAAH